MLQRLQKHLEKKKAEARRKIYREAAKKKNHIIKRNQCYIL